MSPMMEAFDEDDRFDLRRFGVSKSQTAAVSKTASITIHKPRKDQFVQVHPNLDMRMWAPLVEDKRDFETRYFLVIEDLQAALAESRDLVTRLLVPTMSSLGSYFLWPINVAERNGELTGWASSAMDAVEQAAGNWVRVQADTEEGSYTTFPAQSQAALGAPDFPEWDMEKLIALAFRGKVIDSLNHPFVQVRSGRKLK